MIGKLEAVVAEPASFSNYGAEGRRWVDIYEGGGTQLRRHVGRLLMTSEGAKELARRVNDGNTDA